MSKNKEKIMSGETFKGEEEVSETGVPSVPDEKVEVSKGVLEDIKKQIAGLKRDKEMLLEIADTKRLSQYYQRNQQEIPKIIRLRTIDDKVITGWGDMPENKVAKDPVSMKWNEVQKVNIIFEDGTDRTMFYLDYSRLYNFVEARVISRSTDEITKNLILKVVRLDTNVEYNIDVRFVN